MASVGLRGKGSFDDAYGVLVVAHATRGDAIKMPVGTGIAGAGRPGRTGLMLQAGVRRQFQTKVFDDVVRVTSEVERAVRAGVGQRGGRIFRGAFSHPTGRGPEDEGFRRGRGI